MRTVQFRATNRGLALRNRTLGINSRARIAGIALAVVVADTTRNRLLRGLDTPAHTSAIGRTVEPRGLE
jgi:hypothetical protein